MSRLFGQDTSVLVGQSLYRFLPREQADEQLKLIRGVLDGGRARRTETLFNIQNEEFWFNIQYIPVKGQGQDEQDILGIGRDITDRKSLEKQLINTEKLASLGTLAAGVAHEINNPLGIILGFCDLLLERIEPGTMEYNDLKTIERHGLHCKSIVERLLSFARISEESEEHCDINENVDAILSVVKHTLDMNNIRLLTDLSENLPQVRGDSRGLQQVLLNLISNAVHAMHGEGTLSVNTRPAAKPGWVETIVADTGDGIKKEFLQKIFDPFFTTKKVGEGTGLGLSVSYGIISKYGGTIECESETRESGSGRHGTAFRIVLPVHDASSRELPPEDAEPLYSTV
jgi:PAS domain S-box-containing protein